MKWTGATEWEWGIKNPLRAALNHENMSSSCETAQQRRSRCFLFFFCIQIMQIEEHGWESGTKAKCCSMRNHSVTALHKFAENVICRNEIQHKVWLVWQRRSECNSVKRQIHMKEKVIKREQRRRRNKQTHKTNTLYTRYSFFSNMS